ncbi:polysaccharide deacetylase family protein [Tuberibacillus sp. Marseille-P3662]|uniref:polysaccharide deacetylase family protein n=1 Tax=Tuberibacillus sp. Marseille-P3662 TaxID=1965358 RepID=UPI000A1CA01A|nr:polysaccharide deacetylase family protein [Tuberibacillus sp. Marseille-P3662]
MKRFLLQITVFVFILLITAGTYNQPFSVRFLSPTADPEAITTDVKVDPEDDLYQQIKAFAEKHDKKPINAVHHKVWKAIPGLNGVKVQIDKSYKKMKADDGEFDREKIAYEQIPPKVHLSDLPPAPIFRGNPKKPMVSLMINVAWGNDYIPKILKILNKYQVKATFFLEGRWVKNNSDLAMMISDEGHEIGNHGLTHPDFSKISPSKAKEEMTKTSEVIEATLDIQPSLFAPPSGSYNQKTVQLAKQQNMKTIMWTVDAIDWKKATTPDDILRRVNTKVQSGSLILMHPTEPTVQSLERMIASIQKKGYRIGTVSKLIDEKRIRR